MRRSSWRCTISPLDVLAVGVCIIRNDRIPQSPRRQSWSRNMRRVRSQAGFTLIELLVTVFILGLLVTLVATPRHSHAAGMSAIEILLVIAVAILSLPLMFVVHLSLDY